MSRTLHIKPLVPTDRLLQAVQASSTQFLTMTQRGVQLWQVHEGEIVRLRETHLDQPLLLVLTHQHQPQAQDHVTRVITGDSHYETGAWACRMAYMSQKGLSDHDYALNMPDSQYNDPVSREPHPSCSNTICPPAVPGLSIEAVSVYKGIVHVYGISGELDKSKQAMTQTTYDFTAAAAAADPYEEGECSVHAMAFMPAAPSGNTLFLVCLVSYTGFDYSHKKLHCLAVRYKSKLDVSIKIADGPWTIGNVDSSMTLLQDATALQCTAAGVVSVSSHSVRLHPAIDNRATTEATATAAPVDRELCSIELAGVPTAFRHLQGFKWALADTMAELWIIHLADAHRLCRITAGVPLTVTHFMCLAADPEADADCPIQLFLGSRTDTSQLLSIPRALIQDPAPPVSTSKHADAAASSSKQVLEPDSVQRLPAFDCAAPIHDAVVFQDPPGCGECRLMMGCGVAPRGSLKLAHLAAKLTPSISGGPHMPGGPTLKAVKAEWQQQHHAYLAFSYPLEGATSVLDIQGTHFQPVTLPGLNPNCPSLLLAALPGGWMVQVTDQEVRVLNKDGLVGTWDPPDLVTIAASCGSLLALVHSNAVNVLSINGTSGQVNLLQTLHYPQQVSAAAILESPDGMSQDWQDTWLAVGLWAEDTVLLQHLSGRDPSCRLDCADLGQPRSVVAAEMHGTWFLFVGTSQGWVVYHPITWGSSGEVKLGAGVKAHAGISTAQLTILPAHGTTPACVYAQSSKALLLRPSVDNQASGSAVRLVEAVRVHGGEGVSSCVGVHTPDLPHSLAWLSPGSRLTFGELDHTTHLRWFTLGLEDTPQHLAYHEASGHVAVVSNSPSGASWLRLVHAASLTQVVALQLRKGHKAVALCTARLPSSSSSALQRLPGQPAPEKEFIIVASYLEGAWGTSPGLGWPQGLLSIFEVCPAGSAGPASSAAGRCKLKVHGSCKLDSPCYSLATAPVHPHDAATNFGDRHSHAGPQVVIGGCQGEVQMYSLFVDDTAQAGQQAVATARQALAQGEPLPQVGTSGAGAGSQAAGVDAMASSSKHLASQGWTDQVRLQVISKAKTAGGSSLVTSLCTLDNTVLACSFMLSLSLFTTRAHQGKAGLEPLAANISLDILLDGSGEVYHDGPIQVQSAGLFNGQCLLAGAYPDGLLLLERDLAQEVAGCQARQREREKKQLEGSAQGNASSANDQIPEPCNDGDIPDVYLRAGCNLQQGATSFCRASLRVRRMPHTLHPAAAHEASDSCSEAQQVDAPDDQMVVTTSDGQVFAVSVTDAEVQSSQDKAKRSYVELQRAKWVSSMSATGALQLGPVAVDACILET